LWFVLLTLYGIILYVLEDYNVAKFDLFSMFVTLKEFLILGYPYFHPSLLWWIEVMFVLGMFVWFTI